MYHNSEKFMALLQTWLDKGLKSPFVTKLLPQRRSDTVLEEWLCANVLGAV